MKFTDRIVDNVHGLINITQVEKEIIELPIFKRLQHIKQQTLVSRIFPGSEHTRYAHSLGVMHIADKIALKLDFDDENRQLIRLAGLLHDIGHYPFSHSGECSYTIKEFDKIEFSYKHYKDVIFEAIAKCIPFKMNSNGEEEFSLNDNYMKQSEKKFHHELVGQRILLSDSEILRIVRKHCPFIENLKDICDIITGIIRKPELSIHVQIIHSELDADGLDYMIRDSKFAGTSFGSIELDYLINCLCVKDNILAIESRGISAADQYLLNKFFSYMKVVYNKRAAILDFCASEALKWMQINQSSGIPDLSRLNDWIDNHGKDKYYLKFTDNYVWHAFEQLNTSNCPSIINTLKTIICEDISVDSISEFELITSSQIDINQSFNSHEIKKKIETNDYLPILHSRRITKHVPEQLINNWWKAQAKEEQEETELKDILTSRLQDGISVWDANTDHIHLLCDDSRSIMRQLYRLTFVFIRLYEI